MIDFEEIPDGETWELFARDFLETYGFYIHSNPSRGADGGRDILVTENIHGYLGTYQYKWLVSCKHYAVSNRSVNEADEPNILERVKSFGTDGFIGFYSTIASSGLGNRLDTLRANGDIKDFKIFDGKFIENNLITGSYSPLILSYMPLSYKETKPIHLVCDEYQPLLCEVCSKDLLLELYTGKRGGNIIFAHKSSSRQYEHIYAVCAGRCDKYLEEKLFSTEGLITAWCSLSDITIPINYLRHIFSTMNRIRENIDSYTDEAYSQEKDILLKLAQKVLRYTNNQERERVKTLLSLPTYL